MEPQRWQRVQELFESALDREAADRDGFLDEACAGDAGMRAEVEAMLRADARPSPLLDGKLSDAARAHNAVVAQIGPYRVVRALGGGGMGQVLLARRTDGQFEQEVALKLVRPELLSSRGVRRFASERQILARLSHPNIARLVDGGITEDGVPWFAMEHVVGVPIDEHCERHQPPLRDLLRLFRDVCAAVQYAHAQLVVHRDLKPGNVLVTPDGTVKLLDFGIAKALGEPDSGLTHTSERVMTPEYAAPEQVRGEPVTTATDVYALGVLLYEMLTRRRLWDGRGSPVDLERAICETVPPPPSTVATGIDRDLDWICLTALRKEPARRYGSAAELRDDIDRFLTVRPVRARGDTLGYRAGKFARRHATLVVAGAASLVAIAGVTAAYTVRLERERARVQAEAEKANQVARFLTDLFAGSDPEHARGAQVTARELLHQGRRRIVRELAGQPEVRADLMGVLGHVHFSLGLFEEAGQLLDEALRLRRAQGDEAETARVLDGLGGVRREQARYDEAEALIREALAIRRRLGSNVADSLDSLGEVQREKGEFDDAAASYQESLAVRRRAGAPATEVAGTLSKLALVFFDRGEYPASVAAYREALAVHRGALGEDHPQTATDLHELAHVLRRQGEFDEAERLYRRALVVREALYGDEYPDTADSINHLARLLYQRGRLDEAEKVFRRSVALHRKLYGSSHAAVSASLGGLAGVLLARGDAAGAQPLYRESLAILKSIYKDGHPYVAAATNSMAAVTWARGETAEGVRLYQESLALHRKLLRPGHVDLARPLVGLGIALRETGDPVGAEPLLREALELRAAALKPEHDLVVEARIELGACLVRLRRFAEAEPLLLEGERRANGTKRARQAIERVAELYEKWGRREQAALRRQAIAKLSQ